MTVSAAALALTACGGQVKAGAAATFNDGRITTASLDDTVNTWMTEFKANPAAAQVRQNMEAQGITFDPSYPRQALDALVRDRVVAEAARQQGITATPQEVQSLVSQLGGERSLELFTLAIGLPASHAQATAENQVLTAKLIHVVAPTQAQSQAELDTQTRQLASIGDRATGAIDLQVNPRYGSYDFVEGLRPVTYGLSKPDPALNGA